MGAGDHPSYRREFLDQRQGRRSPAEKNDVGVDGGQAGQECLCDLMPAAAGVRTRGARLAAESSVEQQHTRARPGRQITTAGCGQFQVGAVFAENVAQRRRQWRRGPTSNDRPVGTPAVGYGSWPVSTTRTSVGEHSCSERKSRSVPGWKPRPERCSDSRKTPTCESAAAPSSESSGRQGAGRAAHKSMVATMLQDGGASTVFGGSTAGQLSGSVGSRGAGGNVGARPGGCATLQ